MSSIAGGVWLFDVVEFPEEKCDDSQADHQGNAAHVILGGTGFISQRTGDKVEKSERNDEDHHDDPRPKGGDRVRQAILEFSRPEPKLRFLPVGHAELIEVTALNC